MEDSLTFNESRDNRSGKSYHFLLYFAGIGGGCKLITSGTSTGVFTGHAPTRKSGQVFLPIPQVRACATYDGGGGLSP